MSLCRFYTLLANSQEGLCMGLLNYTTQGSQQYDLNQGVLESCDNATALITEI